MSVVACRVTKDYIQIASDSIIVRGWTQAKGENGHGKLVQINDLIIGSVGSAQESSLFQLYCTTRKPAAATEAAILEFISDFAEWKRKKTSDFYLLNNYILVVDKKAFCIEKFFVEEIKTFQAIGAGMDFALASMKLGTSVETAVKTACELSAMCEEPIIQFEIKK